MEKLLSTNGLNIHGVVNIILKMVFRLQEDNTGWELPNFEV